MTSGKTTRFLMAMVWGVLVLAPGAGAADLAQRAAALDRPAVGGVVQLPGPLRVGRGAITPAPGTEVRLLSDAGTPCGLMMDGPGRFVYVVEDRWSAPVAERNTKRASHISPGRRDGSVVIAEEIRGAVVWGRGLPAAVTGPGDAASFPGWAAEVFDNPFFSRPSHELLTEELLHGSGVRVALLRGGKEDLLLDVDPVDGRQEGLYRVERYKEITSVERGRYYLEELAAQPVGRSWTGRFPAPLVAVAERIAVDNDHGEHVTVSTTTELRATRGRAGVWRVGLVDHRVKNGKIRPVTIGSVKVNGRPADFLHQDGELMVVLDPPPGKGAGATVEVVNEGEIALHPKNDSYWSLGTWAWYPQPPLNGEFATVDLTVRVAEPFVPFASGAVVSRSTADGFTVLRTRLDKPSQFPVAAAGKYHIYTDQKDGVRCNVASYVFGKERACNRLIENFFAASKFYGDLFGVPWPYPEFSVVEVNTWGFGQAPPGLIFITKEAYQPLIDTYNQFFSAGVNERYVHEVAHAWWGHTIMMDSAEEQWLTESFAEYSAALFLEAARGGGKKGRKEFKKLLDGWRARAKLIGDGGSIYLANHLAGTDRKDWEDRTNLLYSKGPLVLHAVRLRLRKMAGGKKEGDRLFVILLRSYLKNFAYKWGSTQNLVGILNQMTRTDWQPFFDMYVYGTELPDA